MPSISTTPLPQLPVSRRTMWLLLVAQMEQTAMNVLILVVGVIIPMFRLYSTNVLDTEPGVLTIGWLGGAGLLGVVIGAPLFGRIGDRVGYLWPFRLCGAMICLGGLMGWLASYSVWVVIASLFIVGLGIGGGYSLDEVYLSELMPKKTQLRLIGLAKTVAAFGACWGGVVVYELVKAFPSDRYWSMAMAVMAVFGLVTVLMRVRWWESPKWLMLRNRQQEALSAARHFYGPNAVPAAPEQTQVQSVSLRQLLQGNGKWKVIAASVPWALDGIAAYGMGNFMPVLLMQLGFHFGDAAHGGVAAVEQSVLLSAGINLFITVGYFIGLMVMDRVYHIRLMASGFAFATVSVIVVILTSTFSWNIWVGLAAFCIFEAALSAGPGLITFVLPSEVFTPAERGTGAGIAAGIGKTGALVGVFVMPVLIKHGGAGLTLAFCAAAMVLGMIITVVAGRKALPRPQK